MVWGWYHHMVPPLWEQQTTAWHVVIRSHITRHAHKPQECEYGVLFVCQVSQDPTVWICQKHELWSFVASEDTRSSGTYSVYCRGNATTTPTGDTTTVWCPCCGTRSRHRVVNLPLVVDHFTESQ
jgi:hypothetical protein